MENVAIMMSTERLLKQELKATDQALSRLSHADDSEALHDFRVALHRMRSRLRPYNEELKEVRRLSRKLCSLMHACDSARNAEACSVLLKTLSRGSNSQEFHGIHEIQTKALRVMQEKRMEAFRVIQSSYPHLRLRACELLESLGYGSVRMSNSTVAFKTWAVKLGQQLNQALLAVWPEMEDGDVHHARILTKNLRYFLESEEFLFELRWRNQIITGLTKTQNLLGDWRNTRLLADWLTDMASVSCGARARKLVSAALLEDVQGFAALQEKEALPGLIYIATRLSAHMTALRQEFDVWFNDGEIAVLLDRLDELREGRTVIH
ncbi:CHAD domain-containing protein [Acidihalobacter prosperus]